MQDQEKESETAADLPRLFFRGPTRHKAPRTRAHCAPKDSGGTPRGSPKASPPLLGMPLVSQPCHTAPATSNLIAYWQRAGQTQPSRPPENVFLLECRGLLANKPCRWEAALGNFAHSSDHKKVDPTGDGQSEQPTRVVAGVIFVSCLSRLSKGIGGVLNQYHDVSRMVFSGLGQRQDPLR